MNASDWVGLGLLIGDVLLVALCLTLAFFGWWWMLPFAVMCGVPGVLIFKELWGDWP